MIDAIASYLCDVLEDAEVITEVERDDYHFGFQITLSNIVNFLIAVTIGLLCRSLMEVSIYYLVFVTLRMYCGGYHASSRFKCFGLFTGSIYVSLFISQLIVAYRLSGYAIVLSILLLTVSIFILSPMDHENRRLEVKQKQKFRKCSWLVLGVWVLIIGILVNYRQISLATSASMAFLTVALFMLITQYIKVVEANTTSRKKKDLR